MSYEDSHYVRLKLLRRAPEQRDRDAEDLRERPRDEPYRSIDPVGCGCTDCCIGYTRPAVDEAEYELAKACDSSR
jgi:hypothetical protein